MGAWPTVAKRRLTKQFWHYLSASPDLGANFCSSPRLGHHLPSLLPPFPTFLLGSPPLTTIIKTPAVPSPCLFLSTSPLVWGPSATFCSEPLVTGRRIIGIFSSCCIFFAGEIPEGDWSQLWPPGALLASAWFWGRLLKASWMNRSPWEAPASSYPPQHSTNFPPTPWCPGAPSHQQPESPAETTDSSPDTAVRLIS